MTTQLNTALIAMATLAALTTGVASAKAPETLYRASVVVRYHDLDLSTQGGIHTLYGRIQIAAWRVCGQLDYVRIEEVQCRKKLTEAAVKEVHVPALTALESGKRTAEQIVLNR